MDLKIGALLPKICLEGLVNNAESDGIIILIPISKRRDGHKNRMRQLFKLIKSSLSNYIGWETSGLLLQNGFLGGLITQ